MECDVQEENPEVAGAIRLAQEDLGGKHYES